MKSFRRARDLIRILLVDGHPVFQLGLAQLFSSERDLCLVGRVSEGPAALRTLRDEAMDLVILDLSLRGANSLDLLHRIRAEHPRLPVLVLSGHDEGLYAERVLRAGGNGYLMKSASTEVFLDAVRRAAFGEMVFSAHITQRLLRTWGRNDAPGLNSSMDALSNRQLEVFELVGQGYTARKISELLHISIKTTETHLRQVRKRLGILSLEKLRQVAAVWVHEAARYESVQGASSSVRQPSLVLTSPELL